MGSLIFFFKIDVYFFDKHVFQLLVGLIQFVVSFYGVALSRLTLMLVRERSIYQQVVRYPSGN